MTRILVIDGNALVRTILRQTLEQVEYEEADGEEGMKLLSASPADLVIMDIFMPDKEGIQTIREVRERFPQVKLLAISAGGSRIHLDMLTPARAMGPHGTLAKPFQRQELLDAVNAVLA